MRASSVLLLASATTVSAWGGLGHQAIAYIAAAFVSPTTTEYFQAIIHDTTPDYLAIVASWADGYRYSKDGRFTAGFHYIDANDEPPHVCNVDFVRDCNDNKGCVISAVANYTARLMDMKLPMYERNQAAKFVVHFVGDIHQPLHDENESRGGNGIHVRFNGKPTNLHSLWDSGMAEKHVGGYSLAYAKRWAAALTSQIQSGVYSQEASGWLQGLDIKDPQTSSMIWAKEANEEVCKVVLPAGREAIEGQELNGTYYENAIPVMERQVARAGYRQDVFNSMSGRTS